MELIVEIDMEEWNKAAREALKNRAAPDKRSPGVWILLGKEKDDGPLMCLQVAKTKNIAAEIEQDISLLDPETVIKPVKKCYVNQFGEAQFEYEEYPAVRIRTLYREIARKYKKLIFICAAQDKKLEENALFETIEKYIAYKTGCLYWVNGGSYKNEKGREEIESIKAACRNKCEELFERIKSDYPDGAECLRKHLDEIIAKMDDSQPPK